MHSDEKNIASIKEIPAEGNISELCNKYYHHLKNKEAVSKLFFKERVSIAHEIISEAKEDEVYFYRRTLEEQFSVSDITRENFLHAPAVNLASNDYLGFTKHPDIIRQGIGALKKYGTGSGSVPMLAGTTPLHKELEDILASFTNYEAAITFSSCYAANYGLLTTLLTSSDVAILDTLVHASIIDGCCNTNKIFFKHNDPVSLKMALHKASQFKNKLVIVDGVYSMDGDIALLNEIIEVTKENGAWLMVDESHAIGVIGNNGEGTHSYFSLEEKADIVSCSLGKALGGIGGFIAGSKELISFIELTSRPFIFSTSIPQNVCAQLIRAIELLQTDNSVLKKLWSNIEYFKDGIQQTGFDVSNSQSAIIPLIIRDEVKLLHFCHSLHNDGVFVNPIFFPVVPKRKSRIRISVTAALNKDELTFVLDKIELAAHQLRILK
jgi:glycine C-acetyltransferase